MRLWRGECRLKADCSLPIFSSQWQHREKPVTEKSSR